MDYSKIMSCDVPVLFVGPPGVGKTEIVRSAFDHVEVMLTSTMIEEDIAGLPYRDGATEFRTIPMAIDRIMKADADGKSTCLFLDEIDKARRGVADTLLTLVASRMCGGTKLPSKTVICAAANPPEFGGGDGLSHPMISRFSVVTFEPSAKMWAIWAKSQWNGKAQQRVIKKVAAGDIPLVDYVGEGLNYRITCPRTLALALRASAYFNDEEIIGTIVTGLLTAGTAAQVILALRGEKNDLEATSSSISNLSSQKIKPKTIERVGI